MLTAMEATVPAAGGSKVGRIVIRSVQLAMLGYAAGEAVRFMGRYLGKHE